MTHDEQVETRIAEKYRSLQWTGVCPLEEAIQFAINYRRSLNPEEQKMYDDAILEGWHPERAMSAIEYAVGRDATVQQRKQPVRASM